MRPANVDVPPAKLRVEGEAVLELPMIFGAPAVASVASPPTVGEKPFRSTVAAALRVRVEVAERAALEPTRSVPASTVVGPLWVLRPDRVSVPLPILVRPTRAP